ncbi:MAG: hypothetical protein ACO23H_09855 [Alphaproteobacteria bacterium]
MIEDALIECAVIHDHTIDVLGAFAEYIPPFIREVSILILWDRAVHRHEALEADRPAAEVLCWD